VTRFIAATAWHCVRPLSQFQPNQGLQRANKPRSSFVSFSRCCRLIGFPYKISYESRHGLRLLICKLLALTNRFGIERQAATLVNNLCHRIFFERARIFSRSLGITSSCIDRDRASFEHIAIPYDHLAAARRAEENQNPAWAHFLSTGYARDLTTYLGLNRPHQPVG
jgi:hypothetical protein